MAQLQNTGSGSGQKRAEDYLDLLRGQIDIAQVPFSDRGSRLIVQQTPGQSKLMVKLAERLIALNPDPEAYLARPPFIEDLQFVNGSGEALDFKASASPDVVRFQTSLGEFKLAFQDEQTIAIGLPPLVTVGIQFNLNSRHFHPADDPHPIRHLSYAANGILQSDEVSLQAHGSRIQLMLRSGEETTVLLHIGETKTQINNVAPFLQIHERATARWLAWFEQVPPVDEKYAAKYAYAWWVMANNLLSPRGPIAYETMAPSKASYIGLWLWDSALHAIAYRHVDPELARNQIRGFLRVQRQDGMLPDAIHDEGVVFEIDHPIQAEVTKPPILAWAALKLHETAPDLNFLHEIYGPLQRCNDWWFEHNDDDADGLVQYTHPYSSGLDDSPLWDHGLPVESPDLNTYLYLQMQALSFMADALELHDEAITWQQKAETLLERMLNDLWDEETGFFYALHDEKPIPVETPLNLLPLWTGQLPEGVTLRVLANLADPKKFWGGFMLPTVARDDPAYDPQTMWRGPVWANINYIFIEALQRSGHLDLARELRDATLDLIMSQPSIYEYYHAETGKPPARSVPTFGWTAAVFIDLAIQATTEGNTKKERPSLVSQAM